MHHRTAHEHAAFQGVFGRGIGLQLRGAGGDEAAVALQCGVPGVHEHEAARAVGVFDLACLQASLSQQGRLLVARHAANDRPQPRPKQAGLHPTKIGHRGMHLGQHGPRDAEQIEQFIVPLPGMDVQQQGATGVADVGAVALTPRQLPNQPGVNGAKSQFTGLCLCTGTRNVVEQPAQFGGREIGVEAQAGALLNEWLHPLFAPLLAQRFGAPVLPDDGGVQWHAGLAVPQQGGFALVGDAHAPDVGGRQVALGEHLLRCVALAVPKTQGVVFYPARLRVNLREFLLRHADDVAVVVENNGPGAGGALVECEQISGLCHGLSVGGV